jgi:hypothetical protein
MRGEGNRVKINLAICALGIFFMASTPGSADDRLYVGFSSAVITPKLGDKPIFIAGFGQNRLAMSVLDDLHARTVVLKHGEHKVAIMSLVCFCPSSTAFANSFPIFITYW